LAAVGLSHRSGFAVADASGAGGRAWAARAGESAAGHIVFGPYKPFPAGRYLALFRVKRTGEGAGALAALDVHAEGAKGSAASHTVDVRDAPLNAWRAYPLAFAHEGGLLETRVFWPGKASLAVGEILVWKWD
jgi:hypothetical protein